MKLRKSSLGSLLLVLTAVPLASQSTWRVGPGGDFEDLVTAVERVGVGDTLVLLAGYHSSPTIRRGITILATGASVVWLTVAGVPPGESVRIHGLVVDSPIDLHGCYGAVHLEGCSARGRTAACALQISTCSLVTINHCEFGFGHDVTSLDGLAAVEITDSVVSFVSSTARGVSATLLHAALPAMHAERSQVHLCNPVLSGGAGAGSSGTIFDREPAPGLVLVDAETTISGDHRASCRRGDPAVGLTTTVRDLVAEGGRLRIDPACGVATASVRNLRATVQSRAIAALLAEAVAPGGSLPMELIASPGDVVAAYVGLPTWPIAVPPLGTLWLDSASMVELGSVVLTGRSWITSIPLPGSLAAGQTLTFQGMVLRSGGALVLSESVSVVLPERR